MHRDPTEFRERFKRWKSGERVYDSGYTLPAYEDGKSPGELEETYFGQLLPTVTIEGHKPTLWENIGNWFVDASKRAAFNENPAVMTASGWTAYPDGSTRQDAFNTPERNDLANKLVDIGVSGATDVWGGPIANWAIGKVWNKIKPPFKITQKNAHKVSDAQWDEAYMRAVYNDDLKEAQKLRDLHFKAKAPKTKVVDETGMPKKTYHVVGDEYDPNFNEFDPDIEGTHSAIYSSSDLSMSGSYSKNIVSETERNNIIEYTRKRELERYMRYVDKSDPFVKKQIALYSNPKNAKKQILKDHPWVNSAIESNRMKTLYVNLERPVIIDADGRTWNNIPLYQLPEDVYKNIKVDLHNSSTISPKYTTRSLERAQMATGNYDGSIIKNVRDYGGNKMYNYFEPGDVYLINSNTSVKLADPITYDNAGNAIPLSKRDNFNIKDIRYVLPWIFGGSAIKYYNK